MPLPQAVIDEVRAAVDKRYAGRRPLKVTQADLAQHATPESCWVIVRDKVYDVTDYLPKHPGGGQLLTRHAGGDATDDFFGGFHSKMAPIVLEAMYIGDLVGGAAQGTRSGGLGPASLGAGAAATLRVGAPGPARKDRDGFVVPAARGGPGWVSCKLLQKAAHTEDTVLLTFQVPPELGAKLAKTLTPCWHFSVRASVTRPTARSYTPIRYSSGVFELCVRKYDKGTVSRDLHRILPGQSVQVFGPIDGQYRHQANQHQRLLLVAGGTGITPMVQILAHIAGNSADRTAATLVACNRTSKDRLIADRVPKGVTVHYHEDKGHITKADLERAFPGHGGHAVVCGPPGFNRHVEGLLKGMVDGVHVLEG